MRRNRSTVVTSKSESTINQPSTPIHQNQNSNSCSNDTTCSSNLHSSNVNQLNINSNSQAIVQNEIKIRALLKELQNYVGKCQVIKTMIK